MQGDCSDGRGSGVLEADFRVRRNTRQQQARNAGDFRMNSMTSAGAGYAIAGLNVGDTLSNGNHGSGAAVAGGARLIHAAADCGDGRCDTIAANFIPNLAHQIGTHSRLLEKILAGKLR